MGKVDDYRLALEKLDDWMPYLAVNSGLPGPRGNLELVAACGEEADAVRAQRLITSGDEFATVCGLVALGRVFGQGDDGPLDALHAHASDERWRVREGVAMAVQRAGDDDLERVFGSPSDGPSILTHWYAELRWPRSANHGSFGTPTSPAGPWVWWSGSPPTWPSCPQGTGAPRRSERCVRPSATGGAWRSLRRQMPG